MHRFFLAMIFLLVGCQSPPEKTYISTLQIIATDDANQNSAVPVDVVLTSDVTLEGKLLAMSARDYFRERTQLLRDYPYQMMVVTSEVVPGQKLQKQVNALQDGARKGFVFANYKTPDAHRHAFSPARNLVISLERNGFQILQA